MKDFLAAEFAQKKRDARKETGFSKISTDAKTSNSTLFPKLPWPNLNDNILPKNQGEKINFLQLGNDFYA